MFEKIKSKPIPMALIAMGAIALFSACHGGKNGQHKGMGMGQENVAAVQTQTVGIGDMNVDASYPATIKGKVDVEVRPMVSGNITRVCVEEGQRVTKGQLLFLIDDIQYQAALRSAQAGVASARSAVASAQAQVVSAQSSVATAQLTASNQKKLLDKGIISSYQYETSALQLKAAQSQLQAAQSGVAQAQSGLRQAQQAVVNARKNLSYSHVTAPCNGIVGVIPNREGSLASPSGQPLTTVSDNSSVYAYFSLNEKQTIELTQGGRVSLETAISKMPSVRLRLADGTTYAQPGRVSTVAGVLSSATGSASVRALFPNTNGMLRSGSTGEVLIPAPTHGVIVIPQKATYEVQDQKYVYVLDKNRMAVGTPIKVNKLDDGQNYAVTEGLNVGDVIVVEGVGSKVKEGTKILTPQEAAAMAAQMQQAQGEKNGKQAGKGKK